MIDQTQFSGSMGAQQRPKQRAIDKILMRNRDQKAEEIQQEQSLSSQLTQPNGAAVMGMGPGTNIFGGQSAFNRPNTLALILGGR